MDSLSDMELGWMRIDALVNRDKVVRVATCTTLEHRAHAEYRLALLGWTLEAFIREAYPEFDYRVDD